MIQWIPCAPIGDPSVARDHQCELVIGRVSVILASPEDVNSFTDALLGLRQFEHARLLVGGVDPANDPVTARRRLCLLPPNLPLRSHLSVFQQVQMLVECGGCQRPSRNDVINALRLGELPDDRVDATASTLSPFERFSTWLAIHRLRSTPALVVDQPGVDLTRVRLADMVRLLDEVADAGVAVVVMTDDETTARGVPGDQFTFLQSVLRISNPGPGAISAGQYRPTSLEARQ